MEIVYHIGAHETDEDRLLECLLKNRETLVSQGIAVPNPGRYRKMLREVLNTLEREGRLSSTRDEVVRSILGDHDAERVVMSNPNFCCINARVFERGHFYALGPSRVRALGTLLLKTRSSFIWASETQRALCRQS